MQHGPWGKNMEMGKNTIFFPPLIFRYLVFFCLAGVGLISVYSGLVIYLKTIMYYAKYCNGKKNLLIVIVLFRYVCCFISLDFRLLRLCVTLINLRDDKGEKVNQKYWKWHRDRTGSCRNSR